MDLASDLSSLLVLLLAAEAAFLPTRPLARRLACLLLCVCRTSTLLLTNRHVDVVVQLAKVHRRTAETAFPPTCPLATFFALVLRFSRASGGTFSRHVFACVLLFPLPPKVFASRPKSESFPGRPRIPNAFLIPNEPSYIFPHVYYRGRTETCTFTRVAAPRAGPPVRNVWGCDEAPRVKKSGTLGG